MSELEVVITPVGFGRALPSNLEPLATRLRPMTSGVLVEYAETCAILPRQDVHTWGPYALFRSAKSLGQTHVCVTFHKNEEVAQQAFAAPLAAGEERYLANLTTGSLQSIKKQLAPLRVLVATFGEIGQEACGLQIPTDDHVNALNWLNAINDGRQLSSPRLQAIAILDVLRSQFKRLVINNGSPDGVIYNWSCLSLLGLTQQ